jgi:oxidase EvaA
MDIESIREGKLGSTPAYTGPLHSDPFLASAFAHEGVHSNREVSAWLEVRQAANHFRVTKKPLEELRGWRIDPESGNIVHQSGRFFSIEGISIRTNFGRTESWMQPIIVQRDIGILGFLTQRIQGVLHFLVQAKMEPGNVNILQLSPTVQATPSNYTRVHGGGSTPYLEYFLEPGAALVHVDQLQSEQGSRFLRKRNRNMIVEIPAHEPVPQHPDFCWLTLGQLFQLLRVDNLVNMDSRTVLSAVRFGEGMRPEVIGAGESSNSFADEVLLSLLAPDHRAQHHFDYLLSFLTRLKAKYLLNVEVVPLNCVRDWRLENGVVRHVSGRFFSVIGVGVEAGSREVRQWDQPLIESAKGGIIMFVCQRRNGILHFLVQARVEPGNFDAIELAPTVQCTPSNYGPGAVLPPFVEYVNGECGELRYCAAQSEEGGRFYHDCNTYQIVEADETADFKLPENYIWMSLQQIKNFIRFNNMFNIEARGLLSCISVTLP